MIRRLLQHSEFPAFRHKWVPEDIRETFFKCTRWQLEETMDPINCPYHYFCDSTNPANYPPAVNVGNLPDNGIVSSNPNCHHNGDIWGYRVNLSCSTMEKILCYHLVLFPSQYYSWPLPRDKGSTHCFRTSMLRPIQISALDLNNAAEKNGIKYAFYMASTISGILRASLYLDSTILPYYTGFDALVLSTFSGECKSCVCRKEVPVVGGKFVSWRGWSLTTFLVIGILCLRIICRLSKQYNGEAKLIKTLMENSGWIAIAV